MYSIWMRVAAGGGTWAWGEEVRGVGRSCYRDFMSQRKVDAIRDRVNNVLQH